MVFAKLRFAQVAAQHCDVFTRRPQEAHGLHVPGTAREHTRSVKVAISPSAAFESGRVQQRPRLDVLHWLASGRVQSLDQEHLAGALGQKTRRQLQTHSQSRQRASGARGAAA